VKLFSKNSTRAITVHQRHRDGRTDGRTTYHDNTALRYASRGKNRRMQRMDLLYHRPPFDLSPIAVHQLFARAGNKWPHNAPRYHHHHKHHRRHPCYSQGPRSNDVECSAICRHNCALLLNYVY